MTSPQDITQLAFQMLDKFNAWLQDGQLLAIQAMALKSELELLTGAPIDPTLDPTPLLTTAYTTGIAHRDEAGKLLLVAFRLAREVERIKNTPVPEDPVFGPGGAYEHLPDPIGSFEPMSHEPLELSSNNSDQVWTFPTAKHQGKRYLGDSASAPWGDHGPLWGFRCYNVEGEIRDLEVWRCGDFHKGREGHLFYFNVFGDLLISNCTGNQHGGQFLQLVWREGETRIDESLWNHENHTVRVENCQSIDGGCINEGMAVRASWPIAFYNPGQSLEIDNFVLRAHNVSDFQYNGITYNSHGCLFVGPGQVYRRTPNVIVRNVDAECLRPDRSMMKFWGVDNVLVENCRLVAVDGECSITIVDDCGRVELRNIDTDGAPLKIKIAKQSDPYRADRTVLYDGTSFLFEG